MCMPSFCGSRPSGPPLPRTPKSLETCPGDQWQKAGAVFSIWGPRTIDDPWKVCCLILNPGHGELLFLAVLVGWMAMSQVLGDDLRRIRDKACLLQHLGHCNKVAKVAKGIPDDSEH